MRRTPIQLLIVFAWILLTPAAPALSVEGTVQHLAGNLWVKQGAESHPAKVGEHLAAGATLDFRSGQSAIVALSDGSVLKLKVGTVLTLGGEKYSTQSPAAVQLEKGAVFASVKKQVEGSNTKPKFLIRTRSVVLGVRGTEFFTATARGNDVWMCVREGSVEAQSEGSEKTLVRAGEGILVEDGSKIGKPQSYAWTKKLNWNMDPAQGEVEDKGSLDSAYQNLLRQNYD